ncbi:MAG TPA: DOMON-like domain-containing protein [Allosphingosinicella sp.]|jgi:hypothetical protein|nr:DOMON-like domain-containing protein [Allosphingosinicella sp.]
MQVELWTHPDHPTDVVTGIQASVTLRSPNLLHLRYVVFGKIGDIVLPPPAAPIRADNLWETTCLEAFLAPAGGRAYREVNFSPSSQWAAYDFVSHRNPQPGIAAPLPAPPEIMLAVGVDRIEMEVLVPVDSGPCPIRLGLAAVIEEKDGTKSYWALAHPPGDPDFHHADCFALELPG